MTPADLRRRIVDLLAATEALPSEAEACPVTITYPRQPRDETRDVVEITAPGIAEPIAVLPNANTEDLSRASAIFEMINSRGLLKEVADYLGDPGMEEVERLVDAHATMARATGQAVYLWSRDMLRLAHRNDAVACEDAARARLLAAIRSMRAPMTVGAASPPPADDGPPTVDLHEPDPVCPCCGQAIRGAR